MKNELEAEFEEFDLSPTEFDEGLIKTKAKAARKKENRVRAGAIVGVIATLALVISLPVKSNQSAVSKQQLIGRSFIIQSATGMRTSESPLLHTITFDKNKVVLDTCNGTVLLKYSIAGDRLVGHKYSGPRTQAFCSDEEFVERFISSNPKISLAGDTLTLKNINVTIVALDLVKFVPYSPLEKTNWTLDVSNDGEYVAEGGGRVRNGRLQFKDGKVTGFGGCNSLEGSYRLTGNKIDVEAHTTTNNTCPKRGANGSHAYEDWVLAALNRTSSIKRFRSSSGQVIVLNGSDGQNGISLQKATETDIKAPFRGL